MCMIYPTYARIYEKGEHSAIQPNSRIQIQDTSDTIQEAFIKSYLLN